MSKRRAPKQKKDCHNNFLSAKPKKAAAGKENRVRLVLLMKLRLGRLGVLQFCFHGNAR